jgi:chromosome segregation ATPase
MAVKETARTAQSQLAELPERVGVVETKVEHLNEKMDDLKVDVKEMHDCLDQTRDKVMAELGKMQDEYRSNSQKFFDHADKLHSEDQLAHVTLDKKIKDLEQFKTKWVYMTAGGIAVLGFMSGHLTALTNFFK